ncbi:MAG: hypothetical protein JWO86_5946 [Myxococcaceae bacterium]|nr:hypothetical protein [Myxococcaceae bacterium]
MPYRRGDPPPAPNPGIVAAYIEQELTRLVSWRPFPWVVGDGRPERDDAANALWTWERTGDLAYKLVDDPSANIHCHYDMFVALSQRVFVVSCGNHWAGVMGRHWRRSRAVLLHFSLADMPDPSLDEYRALIRDAGIPLSRLLWELIDVESPNMEWPT